MNKNVRYLAIAFVIFYLLSQPRNAAAVVNNAFSAVGDAGHATRGLRQHSRYLAGAEAGSRGNDAVRLRFNISP